MSATAAQHVFDVWKGSRGAKLGLIVLAQRHSHSSWLSGGGGGRKRCSGRVSSLKVLTYKLGHDRDCVHLINLTRYA